MIVYGGLGNLEEYSDIFSYNFKSKEWKLIITQGDAPIQRSAHSADLINNKYMVVIGGFFNGDSLSEMNILNLETFTW